MKLLRLIGGRAFREVMKGGGGPGWVAWRVFDASCPMSNPSNAAAATVTSSVKAVCLHCGSSLKPMPPFPTPFHTNFRPSTHPMKKF